MISVEDIIPGETMELELRPTARALLPAFLLSWLVLPFFWGLWWYFAQIRARAYVVTSERVYSRRIFFRKDSSTTKLVDISNVTLHQGIWGRILDFGTVTVTAFSGKGEHLQAVRNPQATQNTIITLARNKQQAAKVKTPGLETKQE